MEIVLTEGEYRTDIMELIAAASWREAVTYRETWPHEYVVINSLGGHPNPAISGRLKTGHFR